MSVVPPNLSEFTSEICERLGLPAGLPSIDALQRATRRQLVDWSERVGLTGLSRLTKDAIADRFHQALATLGIAPAPRDAARERGGSEAARARGVPESPVPSADPGEGTHKFDLGRRVERPLPAHIPWGYGRDRVTAMVVDPERLYVYWEATDDGIAHARAGLGPAGPSAWLSLRVYDVTGRLFDGTNAHAYFDQRIERGDRQWFFTIGKPSSSAIVELGMKSLEGYFVKIVRSGRVDFPRRDPAPPGDVEWLTVHTATGAPGPRVTTAPRAAGAPPPAAAVAIVDAPDDVRTFVPDEAWERLLTLADEGGEQTVEWRGPVLRTTWEAGPFTYPVESPRYVEERDGGRVTVRHENGRTRVVYGPWRVVIRGIRGRAERTVVATWEMQASLLDDGTRAGAGVPPGALDPRGASERRLGGASELWRLSASELRLAGASERIFGGASERRLRGASERRLGSSGQRFEGASERRLEHAAARPGDGAARAAGPYPTSLADGDASLPR